MALTFLDPSGGRYGIPTWPWGFAPGHLFTRGQLREMGFRPAPRVEPAGQLMWRTRRAPDARTALLWDVRATVQRTTPSVAQLVQLADARSRKCVCGACGVQAPYVIPLRLGTCLDCAGRTVAA